ncbi:hypothetical protein Pfl04_34290 [Planosporangium flavigriseum]|uniref:Uncharacterized protein n=2 Tax=Planosporangium flavigriseum TaxID=373681 RepID=A0A8J3LX78_9ACTN|nr:hypothetical protein Pfl04_34290 [Planosporangium flavigriseum]
MSVGGLVLLASGLCALQVSHVRRVRQDRRRLFEAVGRLFDRVEMHHDGLGFPVLTGSYRGYPIRLEPVVDAVGFRKLPVLWLLVTHSRPLEVDAPVDILLRPDGTEFFSPNGTFIREYADSWRLPGGVRIASPDPDRAPPLSAFEPYRLFFAEPRAKELYVGDGGLRLVWRLSEGDQTQYRTTRRANFGSVRVQPADLQPVLETLAGVGDAFAGQSAGRA